jgi:hypothetical protein
MFVTPACPVCSLAAGVAATLAVESKNIPLSIIDAREFGQLPGFYYVMAVAKTAVNHGHSFDCALPEDRFVDEASKGVSGLVAF